MEENGLSLLKQEMTNEEIHIKVNAIHRLRTVILSIGLEETIATLIPYIDGKLTLVSFKHSYRAHQDRGRRSLICCCGRTW